jgi:5-carboxymethyl-2-hydroxymuconate isomerase
MASNEINVTVAVEASIHKALCDFAQHVFDEHGVQLRGVTIDWWNMSSPGEQKAIVAAVQMDTKTMAGRKQA